MEKSKINIPEEAPKDISDVDCVVMCSSGSGLESSLLEVDKYHNRLNEDAQVLTNIFPPEIWTYGIVATHLASSPDHIITLANSSPYFREMMMDKRVLFLVKKVLKIFCNWVFDERSAWDLLKPMRGVCPTWRLAVDELVQEQFTDWNVILPEGIIKSRQHVTKFVSHFAETHPPSTSQTPFIGNLLLVNTDFVEDEGHYWDEFLALLNAYGHHIWHLKFDTVYNWRAFNLTRDEEFYLKFREMLGLLPNFKLLWFEWSEPNYLGRNFVQLHPLPHLLNLTSLRLGDCPREVFFELLTQNERIASLQVNFKNSCDVWRKLKHTEDLELEEIELPNDFPIFHPFPGPSINAFNFLAQRSPRPARPIINNSLLTKLSFEVDASITLLDCRELFQVISVNWGRSLLELNLVVPIASSEKCFEHFLECRLNLPNVKILGIKTDLYPMSIDFLLGMRSLDTIRISSITNARAESYLSTEQNISKDAERAIVKFVGQERVMYESNIWFHFKKLKVLELDGTLFHRSIWDVHYVRKIKVALDVSMEVATQIHSFVNADVLNDNALKEMIAFCKPRR